MRKKPTKWTLVAMTAAVMLIAFATAPTVGLGADHLDAPGLTSPGGGDGSLDIGDLYAFQGSDDSNTVLAFTTNPAAGALSSETFSQDARYQINIDTDGDAIADQAIQAKFGIASSEQPVTLYWVTGPDASGNDFAGTVVAEGVTNETVPIDGGGTLFAGLRSDPFFFDLGGFLGTVEGQGDRQFNDGDQSDPFADFNSLAIIVEVPDARLGGGKISVWGSTHLNGTQIDRIGRPAINTVVNSSGPIVGAPSENKNIYNASLPKDDAANFTGAAAAALTAYSSLDSEGAYSGDQLVALAGLLLPDVLMYDVSTPAVGPLNGRALADDVIDIELRIVTGGDPLELFDDRDADGAINTDSIGPHTDYLDVWPYLGVPHVPAPPDRGLYDVTVKVENLAPMWGNYLTPVWMGFHDGTFDLFNRNVPASPGLERLAEDGNTGPLAGEFAAFGAGTVEGTVAGPAGPYAPNDSMTHTFRVDPLKDRYFSWASMIIPSNDAFVANGHPRAHRLFDENGTPVAKDFFVTGSWVKDAGTEVNDELPANTAFFGQAAPDTGVAEGGVVTVHKGFNPRGSGGILDDPMFAGSDFRVRGYPVAKISFMITKAPADPEPTITLQMGVKADRSEGSALAGSTVSGHVYVWLDPLFPEDFEDIGSVDFLVNGSAVHTEYAAPYDMIGGGTDAATSTWNSTAVPNGATTVIAVMNNRDGTTTEVPAEFTVAN